MELVRSWPITFATALLTAAVLVGAGLLITGGNDKGRAHAASGPTPAQQAAAAAAAASALSPKAALGLGPEGVPLIKGAPLGRASSPKPGQSSGGVPCGAREALVYHVHARLTVSINGKPRSVPLGIGVGAPIKTTQTANGDFVSSGRCFSFLHTHATDGVIHIEAPTRVDFSLGQFFDVWKQRLDRTHLGKYRGRVVAYVNGTRWKQDPRAIVLRRHVQVQLSVGKSVAPAHIRWPQGL